MYKLQQEQPTDLNKLPVVLVKHQADMSSILVYIRSMLSLNLTKYKLVYCLRKSTSTISYKKVTQ